MSARPRVLMVIAFLHHMGGAQRQALRREGLDVSFLTSTVPGSTCNNVQGIPVRRVSFPHGLRLGPLKFHILIRGMVRDMLAHESEYDIIHAHQGLWPAYAATVAAERVGKPCIIKIGNTGERFDFRVLERSPLFGRRMSRHCRLYSDRIVVTSRAAMREAEAYGVARERLLLIPNGVALSRLQGGIAMRRLLGIRANERLVLFIGALCPHKRPLLALESFAALPPSAGAETRLWFLGDGPLRSRLSQRIEQLGLEDRVRLWGEVADVGPFLRAADVFLLPSVAEGMSNALLEAMAHALPCIATRISGAEDLIADGTNGLLVPTDDTEAMTGALKRLLADAALRRELGGSARRTVEDGYSISAIARRYIELYETLATLRNAEC